MRLAGERLQQDGRLISVERKLDPREEKSKRLPWSAPWKTSGVASRCRERVAEESRNSQPDHPHRQPVTPWDWQRQMVEGQELVAAKPVEC